jgi:outer membrane protein
LILLIPLIPVTLAASVSAAAEEKPRIITLEQAYDTALAGDQSIRSAALEIQKAGLLPWSALARLGPQISGNASYNTTRTTLFSPVETRVDHTSRSAGITYQQPLFDFSVFPAYQLGKLSSQAARLQRRFQVRETLFGVAQAYYAVLKQQSVVAVNRETVDLAEQQLALAQKRYAAGLAARSDVLNAQATLENARSTLIQAQGTLEADRDTLSNILNLGGKTDFTVVEPPRASPQDKPFDAILGNAYALREDCLAGAIAVEQDIQRRNEVAAEYAPRIVAQTGEQWTDPTRDSGQRVWSTTVSVSVPFFTGGQREIDLRTANYQISQTRLKFESLKKTIESEVKTAWLNVRTLRESLKAVQAEVTAASQNYHDLKTQYEAGTATSLDVLVALRDLNNARTALTGQTYDYQVALRNLERAEAVFEQKRVGQIKGR